MEEKAKAKESEASKDSEASSTLAGESCESEAPVKKLCSEGDLYMSSSKIQKIE